MNADFAQVKEPDTKRGTLISRSLLVKFPGIAQDADGWDPANVTFGSNKVISWKCHICGNKWQASPRARTSKFGGPKPCPECPKVRAGSSSLLALFPRIAEEAFGWDPSLYSSKSSFKSSWQCKSCLHIWSARIYSRTRDGSGCPKCAGRYTQPISVTHPDLANESHGWDSGKVSIGCSLKKMRQCSKCGCNFTATPVQRRLGGLSGRCPKCFYPGKKIEINSNFFIVPNSSRSLATKHPKLAAELTHPLLGEVVSHGASSKISWWCSECLSSWLMSVHNRTTHGQGCPSCSVTGFKIDRNAFVYFLLGERFGVKISQYGVTNNLSKRISYHKRNGFDLPETAEFILFNNGRSALDLETSITKTLRLLDIPSIKTDSSSKDKFSGYSKSFRTELLPANSLSDLIDSLGLELARNDANWFLHPFQFLSP